MNKKEIYDYLYNLLQEANEDMEMLEWCPSIEKNEFLKHMVFASDDISLVDSGYKLWEIAELASFLAEEEIYDLYSENFGLDKKGKFRIIDFSSFND